MKKKNTDGLQQELMDSPDLTQFLSQNQEQFVNKNVAELLNHLFEKKNISKAALAKQAGMSEIYLHQIFAGRRNPSRNRLLCLCYGLDASVEETQELLKRCGKAQLYPKLKRDAIIYYGLLHKLDLLRSTTNCLMKTKKLYSETTSFHLSHNRAKSHLKHDILSVPWRYQCFKGIFLSVTNK